MINNGMTRRHNLDMIQQLTEQDRKFTRRMLRVQHILRAIARERQGRTKL